MTSRKPLVPMRATGYSSEVLNAAALPARSSGHTHGVTRLVLPASVASRRAFPLLRCPQLGCDPTQIAPWRQHQRADQPLDPYDRQWLHAATARSTCSPVLTYNGKALFVRRKGCAALYGANSR